MAEIRALRADEIECRVQQIMAKGVMLLLYKDARCDMAILDETFGCFGWQRSSHLINGKEFCTVSIQNEHGEWISKQDCGTESNTEKEKGETSDAFKRACVNWGIGRELYTKMFIFASVPTQKCANGKYEMSEKFTKFIVKSIETDNKAKKILNIEIADNKGKTVAKWDNKNPPKYEEQVTIKEPESKEYFCCDCGVAFEAVEWNGNQYSAKQAMELAESRSSDGKARCSMCRKIRREKGVQKE